MHDWEALRAEHGQAIWKIVFRIVRDEVGAMDCFQEVFAEAIQKSRNGKIDNPAGLLLWLAVRRSIDYQRRSRKQRIESFVDDDVIDRSAPTIDQPLCFSELKDRVRRELESLPDKQAEAFWLCCVEEMSIDEIALAMNIRKSHVSVLVHRARKHLQQTLQILQYNTQSTAPTDPTAFKGAK